MKSLHLLLFMWKTEKYSVYTNTSFKNIVYLCSAVKQLAAEIEESDIAIACMAWFVLAITNKHRNCRYEEKDFTFNADFTHEH